MSIATNFAEFSQEIDRFVAQIPGKANLVKRRIALQVLTGVVMQTPVGKKELWAINVERAAKGLKPIPPGYVGGRARGNWQTTISSPATGTLARKDKTGSAAINAGNSTIGAAQPGQDIWISNNLPYIERLEDGHSTQAPNGMVALTLTAVKAQFSR